MGKKILFIAPSCFPVNGAEAIVNIKLLKILSDDGYIIDLISKRSKWENYPSAIKLEELGINVRSITIVEVDNKLNLSTIFKHFMAYCYFGTVFKGAHWAYDVIKKTRKIFEQEYDYVLTKNAPSFLVGAFLKKKYGFRWIASWNDPYPQELYPKPYGDGLDLIHRYRRTINCMNYADFHIFPNERLMKYMSEYLNINIDNSKVIPHLASKSINYKNVKHEKLRIIHSGNVKSPRDPRPLFFALNSLLQKKRNLKIEIDFLGVYDSDLLDLIKELGLHSYINFKNAVDYESSLVLLNKYDVALIIEAPCKEGIFLPTKIGDYMSANIPILTLSPSIGVLKDLFIKGRIQYFAECNNIADIEQVLEQLYEDFIANNIQPSIFSHEFSADAVLGLYNDL